jgi:hypothetical protein
LIVATTSFIDLPSEPVQHVVVQRDRGSSLIFRNPDHLAACFALPKSYSRFIVFLISEVTKPALPVACGNP